MVPKDNKTYDENNLMTMLFLVGIGASVAFILIFGYLGTLVNNEDSCGLNRYQDTTTGYAIPSTFTLTNPGTAIFQVFAVPEKNNLYYEFCFHANYSGSNGAEVHIINANNDYKNKTVLSSLFVAPGVGRYCGLIDKENIETQSVIGVQCITCSVADNLNLYYDPYGLEVAQIIIDDTPATSINVSISESLVYQLYGFRDCKETIRIFNRWYITLIAILAFLFLVLVGYKAISKRFLDMGGSI